MEVILGGMQRSWMIYFGTNRAFVVLVAFFVDPEIELCGQLG